MSFQKKALPKWVVCCALALCGGGLAAQPAAQPAQGVSVTQAWVRATVPGQKATGAFMHIAATQGALRLVGVRTGVAAAAQIHQMSMQDGVMHMHQIQGVDVPAGQSVDLAPGGLHVMLLNLKQPVLPKQTVPMTLVFENAQQQRFEYALQVPVRPLSASMTVPQPTAKVPHGEH
jgi:copper(I)-binding protein